MKSWKRFFGYLKKDFSVTKRDLIPFSIIYMLLTIAYYSVNSIISNRMSTQPILIIPFFIFLGVYSILMLLNQFFFQKKYSKAISVPANTNQFGKVLFSVVKVYLPQFLIFMGVVIGAIVVFALIGIIVKPQEYLGRIFFPIATFAMAIFGFIWFYRILFINYILIYSRINMNHRTIILESKYLLKENLGVVIILLIACLVSIVPQVISVLNTPSKMSMNYFVTGWLILLGVINSYVFIMITVNTIIEHKYYFLLEPKREET